jgi:Rrf2 family protein
LDYTSNVDLTLTRRGDYVVRAAILLASRWNGDGGYTKIREVAEAMRLPLSYTPQLLGILQKRGFAEARAGREGGYRLRRDPASISILEVIEAAEGHLVSQRCPIRGGPCRWDDACALHPTWVKASEAIRSSLATTSLAEVAAVDHRLGRGAAIADVPARHRPRDHTHGKRSTGR